MIQTNLDVQAPCVKCGTWDYLGEGLCQKCWDRQAEGKHRDDKLQWAANRYMRRTKQNLCRVCGKPRENGFTSCNACREKENERRVRLYNARLKAGLCGECGQPRDIEGIYCAGCKAKRVARERLNSDC